MLGDEIRNKSLRSGSLDAMLLGALLGAHPQSGRRSQTPLLATVGGTAEICSGKGCLGTQNLVSIVYYGILNGLYRGYIGVI